VECKAANLIVMFWSKKDKEKQRYYLLPGQGGRNLLRKRRLILRWSIIAGIIVSAVLACLFYAMNRY
jgi:hypothetical protein